MITQLQLLMFSALAFAVLFISGLYPPEINSINLDTDWLYRRAAAQIITPIASTVGALSNTLFNGVGKLSSTTINRVDKVFGPQAWLSRTLDSTSMVALVIGALLLFLGLYLA